MSLEYIAIVAVRLALIVFSVVVHEVSHGFVAWRLGDSTAKDAGRLTLNPVKHLDPFGSVILPLIMAMAGGVAFAYAKPVPYNPSRFENRRAGELAVAFAGPASNMLQALVGAGICWACLYVPITSRAVAEVLSWAYFIGKTYCMVNLWLCFFNIIPLPPLDGASIVALFLSERGLDIFYRVKSYSMLILLLLLFIVPAYTPVDPIGWYFDHTADVVARLLLPAV